MTSETKRERMERLVRTLGDFGITNGRAGSAHAILAAVEKAIQEMADQQRDERSPDRSSPAPESD